MSEPRVPDVYCPEQLRRWCSLALSRSPFILWKLLYLKHRSIPEHFSMSRPPPLPVFSPFPPEFQIQLIRCYVFNIRDLKNYIDTYIYLEWIISPFLLPPRRLRRKCTQELYRLEHQIQSSVLVEKVVILMSSPHPLHKGNSCLF